MAFLRSSNGNTVDVQVQSFAPHAFLTSTITTFGAEFTVMEGIEPGQCELDLGTQHSLTQLNDFVHCKLTDDRGSTWTFLLHRIKSDPDNPDQVRLQGLIYP